MASLLQTLCFRARTGQKAENCSILGPLTLINSNIKVGKNVSFYPGVMLFGDSLIEIGDNVDIGNNVVIYAKKPNGGVKIGSNTMIAAQCYIIDSNHGIAAGQLMQDRALETSAIEIGEDVWLAAGCQVIKGAKIHDGAVIGAGSLVNREVSRNMVAVGRPAQPLKERT